MGKSVKGECREIEAWVFRGFVYMGVRSSNTWCDECNYVSFPINGGECLTISIIKINYNTEHKIYSSLHSQFRRVI